MARLPQTVRLVLRLSCSAVGWGALVFALVGQSPVVSAAGLTINAEYSASRSTPPSSDPGGLQLQSLVTAAVEQWEGVIQDEWYLDLDYFWTDLDDASFTLGLELTFNTLLGKPTRASIRFDSQINGHDRPWYFDATPASSGEFDLNEVLVDDLSAANRQAWYDGAPPDWLEVSYSGSAKPSAPADARNNYDLFSIILHEMGHAVGLSPLVAGSETDDDDYDVPAEMVDGAEMAIKTFSSSNRAHLAAVDTLMYPTFGPGVRRFPSATDILAITSAAGWSTIDLPQRILRGDMDGSGEVNGLDIDPFITTLLDSAFQAEGDMNDDGWVNGLDVAPFVEAVAGVAALDTDVLDHTDGPATDRTIDSARPYGGGSDGSISHIVPEPGTAVLFVLGIAALLATGRRTVVHGSAEG